MVTASGLLTLTWLLDTTGFLLACYLRGQVIAAAIVGVPTGLRFWGA